MLIPLNYPQSQAEVQVAQFIDSGHPSGGYHQQDVRHTVADANTGLPASVVEFVS